MDVMLDQAACELLFKMMHPATPESDEYSEVRLQYGDGHSGHGLYVSLAEYPEEGSVLLAETDKSVRVPQSADEAKAMATVAIAWLREHAPNELQPEFRA